jgi:hypothetical protein
LTERTLRPVSTAASAVRSIAKAFTSRRKTRLLIRERRSYLFFLHFIGAKPLHQRLSFLEAVSEPPEGSVRAGELDEFEEQVRVMLVADDEPAEVEEPGDRAFDRPAALRPGPSLLEDAVLAPLPQPPPAGRVRGAVPW